MGTVVHRSNLAEQAVVAVADALLIYRRATRFGVECGRHKIPHVRLQWRLRLQIVDFVALSDPKLQESLLVDAEAIAIVLVVVPPTDHTLATADIRPDGVDEGKQGEAALQRQLALAINHFKERSDLRVLLLHLPG